MNHLSGNIRFLRKRRKLSQQQLADDLGVKRSNIAAYETKNVEPRLALITALATYFEVAIEDFILTDLYSLNAGSTMADGEMITPDRKRLSGDAVHEVERLVEKVHRMLEGFRIFYEFKLKMNGIDDKARGDLANFLTFITHMQEYNRLIEKTVRTGEVSEETPVGPGTVAPVELEQVA